MHECDFCTNEIDFHEIVECIASALDAKDPYSAGHSHRVSDMALVVCHLMGLKENDTEKIHIAGHLHDIGKNIWSFKGKGSIYDVLNLLSYLYS